MRALARVRRAYVDQPFGLHLDDLVGQEAGRFYRAFYGTFYTYVDQPFGLRLDDLVGEEADAALRDDVGDAVADLDA